MSVTTRVWIAGAGGRLGSALCHRFDRNTECKLVTSDRDVPVEDGKQVGRFADLNHPDVIINCAGLDRRAPLRGVPRGSVQNQRAGCA